MATSRNTSKLLINEYPLQVLPSLACAIGLNEALILQQVHYWLQLPSAHEHDGRRWIYNSYPSWQKQFPFWSVNTVRRAIEGLEDKGYLISGNYNKRAMDKTKWYTIDYAALDNLPLSEWLDPFGNNARPSAQNGQTISSDWADHDANLGRPIPETNTETNNRERETPARPVAVAISRNSPVTPNRDMTIPPGTPVNRRPDAPRPVPKPSDDPAVLDLYTTLKALPFPTRDGKIHSPKLAREALGALSPAARAQVLTGAQHYATAYRTGVTDDLPKDLHNWIHDEDYLEWQEPAAPQARPLRLVSNGSPAPAPALPRLDRAYLQAQKGR